MKRLTLYTLILMLAALTFSACATSKKNVGELKGLMLLDNKQLARNKAYYSSHNIKTKKAAYKKYKNNNRLYYGKRR